jgi:hypothetical protein
LKPIPLNLQTLYADLAQKMEFARRVPAVISRRRVRRRTYIYAKEKHGHAQVQRYLGPEGDPQVNAEASALREEAANAKLRRQIVSILKRAGVPAPILPVGKLLEALSRANYFDNGLILVGTVAYQTYPCLLGYHLKAGTLTTQDADFVVASVGDFRSDASLTEVLRRADPTFQPQATLHRSGLPSRFRAQSGLEVEILTPTRTHADEGTVAIPSMAAGAVPLQYLNFLIQDGVRAVALYNAGVAIVVPQPARYAVHKLIVAQERRTNRIKRMKDLAQARELMTILQETDPHALDDALEDARSRGPQWRTHINSSLCLLADPPAGRNEGA